MSKLRVHEIARELDKTNKEVMDFLKSKNIDVKSHMSSLEDDHVSMIRSNLRKGNVAAASTDSAKPAAPAEEKSLSSNNTARLLRRFPTRFLRVNWKLVRLVKRWLQQRVNLKRKIGRAHV